MNKTQTWLAREMNVDPTYINAIVRGRRYVSEGTLMNLCTLLHVRPWEFYIEPDTPIIQNEEEKAALYRHREAKELAVADEAEKYKEFLIEGAKRDARFPGGEGREDKRPKKAKRRGKNNAA